MPDLYLRIAEQPDAVLDAIASAMDKRASEPAMQAICAEYLSRLQPDAEVLEIGCGNGATSELICRNIAPRRLTGVDPSHDLLERARRRFGERDGVRFHPGNAVETRVEDGSVDIVIAHTVFSHLADPEGALTEAGRVLRPGGTLAVFDGDYATNTVSLFDGDPLQAAMMAAQRNLIHDPYIMRRLPAMIRAAGFEPLGTGAHGYVQTESPEYLLSLLARGIDAGSAAGECGPELAEGLKREAARRVEEGRFYGAILFVSLMARKPGV